MSATSPQNTDLQKTDSQKTEPNLEQTSRSPNAVRLASSLEQQQFIETVGLSFEIVGLPRMAGRILGWLLISDPIYQSPGELAEVLQASKGSISTMTRLLAQIGLIERISLPGQRRDYFRIKPNAWAELTRQRITQIRTFREIAEQGLKLIEGSEPKLRERLEEMHNVHAFLEQELPLMMTRWQQQHKPQAVSAAIDSSLAVNSP